MRQSNPIATLFIIITIILVIVFIIKLAPLILFLLKSIFALIN